jgi:hypothetical protein
MTFRELEHLVNAGKVVLVGLGKIIIWGSRS